MKIPNEGGWTFENTEIAQAFDDHVREQLPWYDLATGVVAHIARHYLPSCGVMYDIGASTGNITKSLSKIIDERKVKVFAVEPSQEMIDIYSGKGKVLKAKAEDVQYEAFDVAVLFLTMMFVSVDKRDDLLSSLIEKMKPGGCIIIFDKTPPGCGYISTVLYRLTLAGKVATGTPAEEILKKELSLSGCQRPYNCTSHLAREVFRFGDFVGWILESEEK